MQLSTVTNVLLGHSEVQQACAEYIERNGVTGANGLSNQVKLQSFEEVVQATLVVNSDQKSMKLSKESTLGHSKCEETSFQLELPLTDSSNESKQDSEDSDQTLSSSTNSKETALTLASDNTKKQSKQDDSLKTEQDGSNQQKVLGEELTQPEEEIQPSLGKTSQESESDSQEEASPTTLSQTKKQFDQDKMKSSPLFTT